MRLSSDRMASTSGLLFIVVGTFTSVLAQLEGPFCGFAPLCGTANQVITLTNDLPSDFPVSLNNNTIFGGAVVVFQDCCSLVDTQPIRDCELVNPSGSAQRFITLSDSLCNADPNHCEFASCENYAFAIRPTFISSQTSGCCDTCSCYGDPECRSFDGTHKMWLLCDGREVPTEADHWDRCRITKDVCEAQTDHAGNQCTYLASNKNGKGWNNVKKGSPCVPNPLSPPSLINMYSAANDNFKLELSQGERGIILSVKLTLTYGVFELSAVDCLTKEEEAWQFDSDVVGSDSLPASFKYTKVVSAQDVLWDIIDPESGIAINLRCYGNKAEPGDVGKYPGGVYVPRINIESLSDPVPNRPNTDGYCVTNTFNIGLANGTERTNYIQENNLCVDGLDNFTTLEIYREICENPALPQTGIDDCIYSFCSKHFIPLFDSVQSCINEFNTEDLATGFCKSIVFVEADIAECVNQWFELGPIATIQQYLNDNSGCVKYEDLKSSPEKCEVGVTFQYLDTSSNTWVDKLFVPENYCGDGSDENGQIILTKCEYPELFENKIRMAQGSADVNCNIRNQCTEISGFMGYIGFGIPPTPSPTLSPTVLPTSSPTASPTYKPSESPTVLPTESPTNSPTESPTKSPTKKPTESPTELPTVSPTQSPTELPTLSPTNSPTQFPTLFPTVSPIQSPTLFPTVSPTNSPTQFPTLFPAVSPIQSPTLFPTVSPTLNPTEVGTDVPPNKTCDYKLCETPEIYYPIDETGMFHTRMESCCPVSPQEACPQNENELVTYNRSQGSNMQYCGTKFPNTAPFKQTCRNNDKLQVKVMFMREEGTQCCLECTCFGDPRCYSFDGTFEEFILCDGRAIPDNNSTEERCIIRKNTCDEQKDHEGNNCIWANAYVDVPELSDPNAQAAAEANFNVARYGSPCIYNESASSPSLILLYKVGDFELVGQQQERGYIHNVYLKTAKGSYTMNVTDCLRGDPWFVNEKYSNSTDYFNRIRFGAEDLWTAIDTTTNIEVSIRCTGVFNDGRITLPFLNIEYVREPNEERANSGTGFCVKNRFDEKDLSTWQHSVYITDHNLCENYNLLMTPIILRNAARAIIDYPGLSTLGTEWAYTDFCEQHFAPRYSSAQQCTSTFMASKSILDVIKAFCKAVTLESTACIENLQMTSDTSGYEEAFNQARIQYVETYDEICTVLSSSDLLAFIPDDDVCKPGVELQYQHPTRGWTTYKAFPTDEAPCNGFIVDFTYRADAVLFEYPIRMIQKYFPRSCSACQYISTADTWYQFTAA